MRDEGKYLQVWNKYLPVIKILLKKTDCSNQSLKLYKHEFETVAVKNKVDYSFLIELRNTRAKSLANGTSVASDLLQVLLENKEIAERLKEKHVKISMDKAFELHLEKVS